MKAVVDLMEKRSAIYSSLPHSVMLNEMQVVLAAFCGCSNSFISMRFSFSLVVSQYGEKWRQHRKAFHSRFHLNVATEY